MNDPARTPIPRPLRRIVAAAVLLSAPAGLSFAFVAALFGGSPATVLGGVLVALGAGPTAWAVWTGAPRHPVLAGCALIFAAGLALAFAVAGVRAVAAWQARQALGEDASAAAGWLGFAAAVALAATLVAGSLLPRHRPARAAALGTLGLAVVLGALALGAAAAPGGCRTFEFDEARWRTALAAVTDERSGEVGDAERIAESVARCGVLTRKDRQAVRRLLGRPEGETAAAGRSDRWFTGSVNDFMGPGDDGELTVVYDRAGRVRAVSPPSG